MTEDREILGKFKTKEELDMAYKQFEQINKEIFIDGVDVAGCCKCYKVEQKILCGASNICANNPNCYYKQLKRLEQENSDLKKQIESQKGLITVGGKQQYKYLQEIDKLQQENKELKEKIEVLDKMTGIFSARLCDTYRSALEEIKRITEEDRNCMNSELACCRLCDKLDLIKDKINEVLQ